MQERDLNTKTRTELVELRRELEEARNLLRTSTVSYVKTRLDRALARLEMVLDASDRDA